MFRLLKEGNTNTGRLSHQYKGLTNSAGLTKGWFANLGRSTENDLPIEDMVGLILAELIGAKDMNLVDTIEEIKNLTHEINKNKKCDSYLRQYEERRRELIVGVYREVKNILGEYNYRGITNTIKSRLQTWVQEGRKVNKDFDKYILGKLQHESAITFVSSIVKELKLDFYKPENMGLSRYKGALKDIPVQTEEARQAGVPSQFNGTIGVLKDANGNIVINPEVAKIIQDGLGLRDEDINNVANYQKGVGMDVFPFAMKALITREEEVYGWERPEGSITAPYFIPGGGGGLTLIGDYFLEEGDLVIVPNYRWPNIDGILTNKTKVPPAQVDFIRPDGTINFTALEKILEIAQEQGRKKVSLYLNFPGNPSGTRMSSKDAQKLNEILQMITLISNMEIQVIIDDPYGAFSITNDSQKIINDIDIVVNNPEQSQSLIISDELFEYCQGTRTWQKIRNLGGDRIELTTTELIATYAKATQPLSYYINTDDAVTVFELGSHGTKEAGVYGLRAGVLRVATSEDKKAKMEAVLGKAFRETFSMSPTLPQIALIKAILGEDMECFANKGEDEVKTYIDTPRSNPEELKKRIDRYLVGRAEMWQVVYPKIQALKTAIVAKCGRYLIPMENAQYSTEQILQGAPGKKGMKPEVDMGAGFVLNFTLTDLAKYHGIELEELREVCLEMGEEGIAFTTFDDALNGERSMRVSLIGGDIQEYAERLSKAIGKLRIKNYEEKMQKLEGLNIQEISQIFTNIYCLNIMSPQNPGIHIGGSTYRYTTNFVSGWMGSDKSILNMLDTPKSGDSLPGGYIFIAGLGWTHKYVYQHLLTRLRKHGKTLHKNLKK